MAVTASPNIVTNGLILMLDAGNDKSYRRTGTVWRDMIGTNNGTLTNGPTFSQSNTGIITFDGTDDYVVTTTNLGISGAASRTMECWFYPKNTSSKNIMGYGSAASGTMFDVLVGVFNSPYYQAIVHYYGANNDTISTLPSRNTLTQNAWNHVVATYDGTTVSVYTNGTLSNSKAATLNTTNSTFLVGKGQYNYAPYDFINADCSLCRVYNRALTANQILQNFDTTKGRFGY